MRVYRCRINIDTDLKIDIDFNIDIDVDIDIVIDINIDISIDIDECMGSLPHDVSVEGVEDALVRQLQGVVHNNHVLNTTTRYNNNSL